MPFYANFITVATLTVCKLVSYIIYSDIHLALYPGLSMFFKKNREGLVDLVMQFEVWLRISAHSPTQRAWSWIRHMTNYVGEWAKIRHHTSNRV